MFHDFRHFFDHARDLHHEMHRYAHPRHRGRGGPFQRPGGPGPQGWFGDFFGPPPRAERGGVRYLVLDAISEVARHGYEVIQAIEQRSGGAYRPSPGVVYPTLQMLEELGHAKLVEKDDRKVYSITEAGLRDLAEHRDEVAEFYDRSAEPDWEEQLDAFKDFKRRAGFLFRSFKRAAFRGRLTPEVQKKIADVLRDALQRLESILGEGDGGER